MDGILCIDKPEGFTSFDVVAKLRGILNTRKIGHAGTLDPMATGVLPLLVGHATKACDLLPDTAKRYTATFRLGLQSDTQDITGTILKRSEVNAGEEQVKEALSAFRGEIMQTPPMYSAVQVGGQRLYHLARAGVEIEREARAVTVDSLELLESNPDEATYRIDVTCSKGTYIRTLCHDIGERLGCGAVLTALRRTAACGFGLDACVTLPQTQDLMSEGRIGERLLPVERAFAALPQFILTPRQAGHILSGVRLSAGQFDSAPPLGEMTLFDSSGRFLGIASRDNATGALVGKKMFVGREEYL